MIVKCSKDRAGMFKIYLWKKYGILIEILSYLLKELLSILKHKNKIKYF